MQVLIVDDDINFAHAAMRGFEREGYPASCALNA
jgi:ActR/RegA family two-component response regulator